MSTIDTSTWNPDADFNTAIEGIPLNADAGIAQTWQALRILMAAVKGDGDAIKSMIDVMQGATASADGASGLVPKPEAGDQDKVLKGDGTWGAVAPVVEAALDAMLKTKIYPVGSTFFSLTDSRNPSVILGFGTWTAIEGRFLLGASSSYAANSTGGEAVHTLTASELPNPTSYLAVQYVWAGQEDTSGTGNWRFVVAPKSTVSWSGTSRIKSTSTTIGQPHNNMPPYLAGYLWRRTA